MEVDDPSNAGNSAKDLDLNQQILKIKQETADNAGSSGARQSGSDMAMEHAAGISQGTEGEAVELVNSIRRTLSEAEAYQAERGMPNKGSVSRQSQVTTQSNQATQNFDRFVQPFALPPPSPVPSPAPPAPRKSSQADPIALVAPAPPTTKPHVFPRQTVPPPSYSLPTASTSASTSSAPSHSTFGRSSTRPPECRVSAMVPFPSSALKSKPAPPSLPHKRSSASPHPFPSRRSTSEDSQSSQSRSRSMSIAAMMNDSSRDGEGIEKSRLRSFQEESNLKGGGAGSDSEDSDEIVLVSTQASPPKKRQRVSSFPAQPPPPARSRTSPPRSFSLEMDVDRSRESSESVSSELSTVDTVERKSSESTAAHDEEEDELMSDGTEEVSEVKRGKRKAKGNGRGGNRERLPLA